MGRFLRWLDDLSTPKRIILAAVILAIAIPADLGIRTALSAPQTEAQRIAADATGTSTTSDSTVTSATCRPGNVMQFYASSTEDALNGMQLLQQDWGDAYLVGPGSTQNTRAAYNTTMAIAYVNGSGDLTDSDICALNFSDGSYGWYDVSVDSGGNVSWDAVPVGLAPDWPGGAEPGDNSSASTAASATSAPVAAPAESVNVPPATPASDTPAPPASAPAGTPAPSTQVSVKPAFDCYVNQNEPGGDQIYGASINISPGTGTGYSEAVVKVTIFGKNGDALQTETVTATPDTSTTWQVAIDPDGDPSLATESSCTAVVESAS
jgi:hypothetical protein